MQRQNILGITGGVGSGKSEVLRYLKSHFDARVLEADAIAKQLQAKGNPGYYAMLAILGDSVLDERGDLDRSMIASLIFQEPELLEKINHAIHPLVEAFIRAAIRHEPQERLIVIESAILFEAKLAGLCTKVCFVYTSRETRIKRLMVQRGYSKERCDSIIERQQEDSWYKKRCDFMIENNGDWMITAEQIEKAVRSAFPDLLNVKGV